MRTIEEILAASQAIIDLAETEARALSDEEVATYEANEVEMTAVRKTSELKARQSIYQAPVLGMPSTIRPMPKGEDALEFAFEQYLRTGQRNADIAQLATFAQTEGTTTAGGYLVPSGFRQKIVEQVIAYGGLRNEAETIDTGDGRPIEWPTVVVETDDQADIVPEMGTSAKGADIVFGTASLGAYRYAATGAGNLPIKVSVELLQDAAFDVGAFVSRVLGRRIARKQAKDLMRGSGSGEPLGLMYGTAGNVEADLSYASLIAVTHAIDPEYRKGAKFIFNDATAALIESLVDANERPLLINGTQGIEGSVTRPTLLGYPVVIDQAAPDANTNDVIYLGFGDLRAAYVVRNVKDVQVLVNPYASSGYVEYDAWARMDGTIQDRNAVALLEGV